MRGEPFELDYYESKLRKSFMKKSDNAKSYGDMCLLASGLGQLLVGRGVSAIVSPKEQKLSVHLRNKEGSKEVPKKYEGHDVVVNVMSQSRLVHA